MKIEKKYEAKYRDRFERKAEKIIDNVEYTHKLINEAMEKADRVTGGPAEDVWANLLLFFDLIKDWVTGRYKNIPGGSIIMILASVLYFLSPFDIIPDFIPGLGYIDDLAVVSYTFKQIQADIDKYLVWKSVKGIEDTLN